MVPRSGWERSRIAPRATKLRRSRARADAAEDRAGAIKAAADERADALEQEAKKLRRDAKQQAERLDAQADALRK
jgi:hypothetical protein